MIDVMKNFHLPLPEETYSQLRAAAQRAEIPATTLAREAIDTWLRAYARDQRHLAIAEFAAQNAGTDIDLDPALEAASIEHLVKPIKGRK